MKELGMTDFQKILEQRVAERRATRTEYRALDRHLRRVAAGEPVYQWHLFNALLAGSFIRMGRRFPLALKSAKTRKP